MSPNRIPDWATLTVIILLAAAARLLYSAMYDDYYDDSYITFRYARNIVEYKGFVYNEGEPVYGASSPLYTYIAAGLYSALGPGVLPVAARWLGILSLFGCALLLYFHLGLTRPGRSIMLIALLSYPRIFYSSIGGMEECFILMLMALSITGVARRSSVLLGVSVGLLLMTKIDTIVWIACLACIALLRRQPSLWRSVVIAAGVSLPWIVFSFLTFDTVVPHTVLAKQVAYAHEPAFQIQDAFLLAVPDGLRSQTVLAVSFVLIWYSVIFLSLVSVIRRREWLFLVFPLYCLAYTSALLISGTSLGLWTRWTVPLWGCLVLCTAYLFHVASPWLDRVILSRFGWKSGFELLALYIFLLVLPFVYPSRSAMALSSHKAVADWCDRNAVTGESIMLEPIGLIGYRSELYVHDFIGLISPRVTEARILGGKSNRWFVKYIAAHNPTYVMLRVDELRTNEFLVGGYGDSIFTHLEQTWFESSYDSVFRTAIGPAVDQFVLFRKRPPPAARISETN
jgi:hypothetical protein